MLSWKKKYEQLNELYEKTIGKYNECCEDCIKILNENNAMKAEIETLKEGIKWRDDGIRDLEDEIDKKNEVIADLKNFLDDQKATIKRQNQQLTEKELYERKSKETAPTGVPAIDATVDRLIRLEAKYEAQQNPYFF
jgi:chromosome segregation ATPase